MTFRDFNFDERIQKGIDEAGFEQPMPVQQETFQLLLDEQRDVYAQSQTGTGKTAAFLLGIFQLKLNHEKWKDKKALVIVPTRELAVQIEKEGRLLGTHLEYRTGAVYGGVGYGQQERMLAEGVDILVGTPGRLIDFDRNRKIDLSEFGFLVIDEADRLFDMGFLPDLRKILKRMKPYNERLTMLFSATLNSRVGNLAWEYMNDPGEVIIEPEKVTVDTVSQELYHVGKDEKVGLLLGLLKRENPETGIIFTNTRHMTWEVAKRLEINGFHVECLMGDLPQSKRLKIVEDVKKGHTKFMVATDVAARGLHINDLEIVVNYDVPQDAESYVHRIGRTARVGKSGMTVTLACEEYVYGLPAIEELIGRKIPVKWADESLTVEDKSAGMRFPPRDRYRELGIDRDRNERNDRDRSGRDRGDRRPRRDDRRPDRKQDQPREQRPSGPPADSKPAEKRPRNDSSQYPRGGKRPVDPKTAKIQSIVSSVAGGGDISEESKKPATKKRPAPKREKSGSKDHRSGSPSKSSPSPKSSRPSKSHTRRDEGRESTERKPERISGSSSLDDRLEYYRQKYGEDFQPGGVSSDGGKKRSSGGRSGRKPSHPRRPSGKRSVSGSDKKREPGKPKKTPAPEPSTPPEADTGLLKKLFGKKK